MKTKIILSCLLAALLPGLALAVPKSGKGARQIDANGDRVITQSEAESAGATRILKKFAEIDTDGNGELTRDELRAYRKNKAQDRRGRAQAADTDGNGALSVNEATAAGMQRLVKNFSKIDANGDGQVTRDEMRQLRESRRGKGNRPRQGPAQGNGQGRGQSSR